MWALERCDQTEAGLKTVQASFASLLRYAKWLESTGTNWWHFPARRRERCLYSFRKHLITEREKGAIASSTAAQTMSQVIRFYRWLYAEQFLNPARPMWTERPHVVRFLDAVGAERTMIAHSTDLAIPNRPPEGQRLEGGLLPVSAGDRDEILKITLEKCSEELFLMLSLGFFTGMRLGTLADLKISTLENAIPDPCVPDLYRLALGPNASPPVKTKYSVNGFAVITKLHFDVLKEYAYSARRLRREAKAPREDKDVIFLTKFGHRYVASGSERSNAINVEMHRLREIGRKYDLKALSVFYFHQSRCTFATTVAQIARDVGGDIAAIALVKELLLHKDEATSMRYIKFIKKTPMLVELNSEFTRTFLDLAKWGGSDGAQTSDSGVDVS